MSKIYFDFVYIVLLINEMSSFSLILDFISKFIIFVCFY